MSFDLDSFKGAAVAVFAVMLAVIDGAADIGVCFSHKKCLLNKFAISFCRRSVFMQKNSSNFCFFSYKFFDEKIFEGRVIMKDTNVYKDIAARTSGDIYRCGGACAHRQKHLYKKVYGNAGFAEYK